MHRLIARDGARPTLAGLAFGLAGSWALIRVLSRLLSGTGSSDALTLIYCGLLIAFTAALACWIPALRATRLQPIVALRWE